MNSLATAELTPGRRSLYAQCVIGVSCAATTWQSMPGAMWPPRRSLAGRRRLADWTELPQRRTLGARWRACRPLHERSSRELWMGIFQSLFSGMEVMVFCPKEIVLRARGAGSDESMLTCLFWWGTLFNIFRSFRSSFKENGRKFDNLNHQHSNKHFGRGFPGGAVVENLPANAGDTGSSPGLGRSHMPRSN